MKTRKDFPHIREGSEVRIRWDLEHGEWYGFDTFNENRMVRGQVITVVDVNDDGFRCLGDVDGFLYTWDMVDDSCLKTNPNTKVRFRFKLEQYDNLLVFQVVYLDPNICCGEDRKFTPFNGFTIKTSNNVIIGEHSLFIGGKRNKSGACSRLYANAEEATEAKTEILNSLKEWRGNNFFDGKQPLPTLVKNEDGEYTL